MVIRQYHAEVGHMGQESVLSSLRKEFWVVKGERRYDAWCEAASVVNEERLVWETSLWRIYRKSD